MEKFVPYGKLSQKKKKAMDREKRNTWGPMNPVTRVRESKTVYDRKKARCWDEDRTGAFFMPENASSRLPEPLICNPGL